MTTPSANTMTARRLARLRRRLRLSQLPGVLISHPLNVRYLTGFTGDSSWLLVLPRGALLLSDPRYEVQIAQQCPGIETLIRRTDRSLVDVLARAASQAHLTTLGFEADHLTCTQLELLKSGLQSLELVSTSGWVESLRAVKDATEVSAIRRAVSIAERALSIVQQVVQPQMTERQIAWELEAQMRRLGALGAAFEVIVAAGSHAALPHAQPRDQRLDRQSLLLVDWGAAVDGYRSDLTRVLTASRISPKLQRLYEVVLRAQQAAIEAIRPGASCAEVDAAARQVIAAAGLRRKFGHGLGHGIGLAVHELPRLSPAAKSDRLVAGMVVTVEPGVYLPGWGGIRIEDDVLVTPDGAQRLSTLPRELDHFVAPGWN